MKTPLLGITTGSPSNSATNYQYISNPSGNAWSSNATNFRNVIAVAGTIDALNVKIANAPGNGKSYVWTIQVNGSDSGCTVTIADSATTGSSSGSATISAGDLVGLKLVPSGTPASTGVMNWYSTFTGSTQPLTIRYSPTLSTSLVKDFDPITNAGTSYDTTVTDIGYYCPTAGTIDKLYAVALADPGVGTSYTLTLYKNGSATALSAILIGGTLTINDLVNSFSVAQGDIIQMRITPTNTPTATSIKWGMSFTPTTADECLIGQNARNFPGANATTYESLGAIIVAWDTSDTASSQLLFPACSLKKLYASVNVAPGAGKSYAITTRQNTADSALVCTIADTNTSASDSTHSLSLAAGDIINIKCVTSASVAAPNSMHISAVISMASAAPANTSAFFAFF